MNLSRRGVLVPLRALKQFSEKRGFNGRNIARGLAFPTCGRPSELRDALQSYAASAARVGHRHSFLVADDSPTPAARQATKQIARTLHAEGDLSGSSIFYMGRPDRRRYARLLSCKDDIPEQVADFALLGASQCGATYGANRNAILLHTHGSRIMSADDDTSCVSSVVPGCAPGVRIHSHGDPLELWFFPTRDSAFEFIRPVDLNPAALGTTVVSWVGVLSPVLGDLAIDGPEFPAALNDTCPHMWLSLCAGSDRILLTANGMAGDSGMAATGYAARMAAAPSLRHRLAEKASYRSALRSREIVRQATIKTMSHTGPVMATCIGLDNQELPCHRSARCNRNEDGVFGRNCSRSAFRMGYAAYLPFVLRHVPRGKRLETPVDMDQVRFSQIVLASLSSMVRRTPRPCPSPGRMRSLGRHLIELGSLAVDDFFDFLRGPLRNDAASTIEFCEHLLSELFTTSIATRGGQDLKRSIREMQRGMADSKCARPTDAVMGDYPKRICRQRQSDGGTIATIWGTLFIGGPH